MITAIATDSRPHVHDHFRAGQPYEVMAGLAAVETVAVTDVTEGITATIITASTHHLDGIAIHIIDPITNKTTTTTIAESSWIPFAQQPIRSALRSTRPRRKSRLSILLANQL